MSVFLVADLLKSQIFGKILIQSKCWKNKSIPQIFTVWSF